MQKKFLLRIDPEVHAALEKWAAAELRSVNGQIEHLLAGALRVAGRLPAGTTVRDRTRRGRARPSDGG